MNSGVIDMSTFMELFAVHAHISCIPRKRFITDTIYRMEHDLAVSFTSVPIVPLAFDDERKDEWFEVRRAVFPGAMYFQNCEGDFKN